MGILPYSISAIILPKVNMQPIAPKRIISIFIRCIMGFGLLSKLGDAFDIALVSAQSLRVRPHIIIWLTKNSDSHRQIDRDSANFRRS